MRTRQAALTAICALLLFVAAESNAQTWNLPIRAGWSNAGLSGDAQLGSDNVNGFVGSFGAALRLNEDFGVEFDIAYAQKGGKGTITNEVNNSPSNPPQSDIYTIEGETNLDYLEFWAMVDGYLGVADQMELVGYLGVSLGNLVRAEASGTLNGSPFETDLKDGISAIDWAGLVGAGFRYELESVTLTIDFIAEIGFVDITEREDTNISTQAYYTMIGVVFPLTREE